MGNICETAQRSGAPEGVELHKMIFQTRPICVRLVPGFWYFSDENRFYDNKTNGFKSKSTVELK